MAYKIPEEENPIEQIVPDGGYTAIFRTLGCIGDSLSSGEHEACDENGVKSYHDYYEYSWGQFIARKCGINVINMSRGGLTAQSFHALAYYGNYFAPENACQGYIIALGVNDATQMLKGNMLFGDMTDVDLNKWENNKNTFVGDYVRILQRIRETEPKARIFMVTPPQSSTAQEKEILYYDKIAEFIRSLAEIFEFSYVIDLRKYERVYDEEFSKIFRLGGHLSAMGYKRTADIIATYIDYIIRHNPEDFKQVGFIGKGVYNHTEKW